MLSKIWLAAAAVVSVCAGPALADADGVIGKMNLKTGIFTPFAAMPDAASKTYSGTVQVTLSIQIKSALPAKQSYICSVSINVIDSTTFGAGPNAVAGIAQAASGKTLKCVVTVPYLWVLPSSDTLTTSTTWSVSAVEATGASRIAGGPLAGFNPTTTPSPKLSASGAL
jgi:hypothetical protein